MIYMILLIWLPLWTIMHIETRHCLIPAVKTAQTLAVVRLNTITAQPSVALTRAAVQTYQNQNAKPSAPVNLLKVLSYFGLLCILGDSIHK